MAKRVTKKERQANIEKLRELIKDIDFAMLSTVDEKENIIRSRPMSTQQVEFDGDLWFFTRADTPKAKEIQQDHQVNFRVIFRNSVSYLFQQHGFTCFWLRHDHTTLAFTDRGKQIEDTG